MASLAIAFTSSGLVTTSDTSTVTTMTSTAEGRSRRARRP